MSRDAPSRLACSRGGMGRCGREAAARRGAVSRGQSTGGVDGRREGPNAKPRRRTPVLVGWMMKAANPHWGLGGKVRR